MDDRTQTHQQEKRFLLRPYQSEALNAVRDAYKAGKRRVIVSLPTGTGKTVVFAHFPKVLQMKKRLLVLAHREELLLQGAHRRAETPPTSERTAEATIRIRRE